MRTVDGTEDIRPFPPLILNCTLLEQLMKENKEEPANPEKPTKLKRKRILHISTTTFQNVLLYNISN